jgi:hypothetical protein
MIRALVFLICIVGYNGIAQSLSEADRNKAITLFKSGMEGVRLQTESLSPTQYNFKPDSSAWSIKDNIEHLGKTEDFILRIVSNILKNEKKDGQKNTATDDQMIAVISKRLKGVKSPEPLVPSENVNATLEEFLKIFEEKRKNTIAYVNTSQEEFRSHFSKHPAFEMADAYQWLLHLGAHTQRHLEQIVDIKKSDRFPKLILPISKS